MSQTVRLRSSLVHLRHNDSIFFSSDFSVAFCPITPLLATGCVDKTVKLWRFEPNGSTASCVATLEGHSDSVYSVAFHPTAPLLATCSIDNTAKLWRFDPNGSQANNMQATCVATLQGHRDGVYSVAFHPTAPLLATGSSDKTAKLWHFSPDGSTVTCVATLEGHSRIVRSVAFCPIAPLLATSSGDKTTKLWRFSPDGSTATCVANLSGSKGHRDVVQSVAFHPTEPLLATGSSDNTAKLWRFSPDGSAANNMQATCVATLVMDSVCVSSVAFHPTEPLLATGSSDATAKLWRFSPDGSAANNMSAVCVETLRGHSKWVTSVAFHPTEPFLATGSRDNTAKIWYVSASALGQIRPSISASVSGQIRPSVSASANDSGLKKVIRIEKELLEPTANFSNKSCPNFMPLYNKIMAIDLNGSFRFEFKGQNAIDLTGLTRILFDKILYVYCNIFFKEQGEFILLKQDVDIQKLNLNTLQLIKLAKAAHAQIILKINPLAIEFLSLPNALESISVRQNFNELYANFINKINKSQNNVSNYLMNKNLQPQINAVQGNLDAVNRALKAEILYRKTISGFGFTSWEQYHNMALFIKTFWNTSNENKITVTKNRREVRLDLFASDLKFDVESFKTRIKIKTAGGVDINLQAIPGELLSEYPALKPLLEYILNPSEEADENRRTFTKYVAGTEYYTGELRIILTRHVISRGLHRGSPFYGHSCDCRVDLFRAPVNYNGKITINDININLKANTSHESSIRAAER